MKTLSSSLRETKWVCSTGTSVLDRIARPRISRAGILITYECNLRCKTCNIWAVNRVDSTLKSKEMKLSEFESFCGSNPDLMWMYFSGGEPSLVGDFGGFVASACQIPSMKIINMSTNGQKPSELTYALKYGLSKSSRNLKCIVDVSLEGLRDTQDKITGIPGSFDNALLTYESLVRLSEGDSRLVPKFEYTVSSYNAGQLQKVLDFLFSRYHLRLPSIVFTMGTETTFHRKGSSASFILTEDERVQEVSLALGKYKLGDKLNLFSRANYKMLRHVLNGDKPGYVGIKYSALMDPYWNVYPTTFHCPDYPVGNLRELDFDLKNLDLAHYSSDGRKLQWLTCDSFITMIFEPWRLL